LELLIRSNSSVITFLKIVTDFQFFRNKDKVARSIKIIAPDSKLFTVTPAKKSAVTSSKTKTGAEDIDHLSSKVAPGMEITYIVKFFPEAKSDYAYDLMIITEREKFIIPIRA
jgi:hydrocephalus-inducing protein